MKEINPADLEFVKLDFDGVRTLADWAKAEGWNPGPHDAEVFYSTDPDGFYGYFLNGKLIAGGSVVSYNNEFGFMGFFIVLPEYRSSGIGRQLWFQRRDHLLKRLNEGAAIGMDGVVAMQPFYEKGGFKIQFRDERYLRKGERLNVDSGISEITAADLDSVLNYDKLCFGFPRSNFMKRWLAMPESFSFKYVCEGKLNGFAVMRKAGEGYKIGPLFADNVLIAEELYKACLNSAPQEDINLDIPLSNSEAVKLVNKYCAVPVFQCARMYYGNPPEVPLEKVFGITTFELG